MRKTALEKEFVAFTKQFELLAEELGIEPSILYKFCDIYIEVYEGKKRVSYRLRGVAKSGERPRIKTFHSHRQSLVNLVHIFRAIKHIEGALENLSFVR